MNPPTELTKEERMALAVTAYRHAMDTYTRHPNPPSLKPSVRKIARHYRLVDTTLRRRIGGALPNNLAQSKHQKLHPKQEEALSRWILQLGAWGCPPRFNQVRFMAIELLRNSQREDDLGVNWIQKFLGRHRELEETFSQPLNKKRAVMPEEEKVNKWFRTYLEVLEQYGFRPEDVCSMEEKGFAMAAQGKLRVVCSGHEERENQEWVSVVECTSAEGEVLKPWVVLKGKVHQDAWYTGSRDDDVGEGSAREG